MKYTAAIAALISNVVADDDCRMDTHCAKNWTQKKCCGDFDCHLYCSKTRCKVDTCGVSKCGVKASDFMDYTNKAGRRCGWGSDHDRWDLEEEVTDLRKKAPTCKAPNAKGWFACRDSDGYYSRHCYKDK